MPSRLSSGARLAGVGALFGTLACAPDATAPSTAPPLPAPSLASQVLGAAPATTVLAGEPAATSRYLERVNRRLASRGVRYGVARAEILRAVSPGASSAARIVVADDRTKSLASQWVSNDIRRGARGRTLTYVVFKPLRFANGSIDAEPAIDASFRSWGKVQCSKLDVVKLADTGVNPSVIFGGTLFLADIVELGFLPGYAFDEALGPGSSTSVLGVTFTFTFGSYDANGVFTPSDIDADGREDTAIKEVWYNDDFRWSRTGEGSTIDVETVALHENGHALELGHFGRITLDTESGVLRANPRAVMNAIVLGVLRAPREPDAGAYCGNWGAWPN
jgi:hypothetical protein